MDTIAVVAHAAHDLRVERLPVPSPRDSDALVAVRYGGICGSDLHYWRSGRVGESVLRTPMVLGHEVVGSVVRQAADGSGPAVGTAVFVHPATVCGMCVMCRAGRQNLCERLTYLGSAARTPHTNGGFAARLVVDSARLRVTEGIAARTAVLIEPAAVAAHAVARATAVGARLTGSTVAVIGAGPIGLLCVALLQRAGAAEIVSTDVFDGALQRARAVGATRTARVDEAAVVLGGLRPDVVFESSGTVAGLATALTTVRVGGVVVLVGQQAPDPAVPMHLAIGRELVVTGSSRFFSESDDVITYLRDGELDVDGVVTHVYPVADALEAFATASDANTSGKVLLDFGDVGDREELPDPR